MLKSTYRQLRDHGILGPVVGVFAFYAAAASQSYVALWHLVQSSSAATLGAGLVGRSLVTMSTPLLLGHLEDRHPHWHRHFLVVAALALAVSTLPLGHSALALVVAPLLPALAQSTFSQSSPRPFSATPALTVVIGWLIDGGKLVAGLLVLLVVSSPLLRSGLILTLSAVAVIALWRIVESTRPSDSPPAPEPESPHRRGRGDPRYWPRSFWITYGALTGLSYLSGYSYDLGLTWVGRGHVRLLALMIVVASLGALSGTALVLRSRKFRITRVGWALLAFWISPLLLDSSLVALEIVGATLFGFFAAYSGQPLRTFFWTLAPRVERSRLWAASEFSNQLAALLGQVLLAYTYSRVSLPTLRFLAPLVGALLVIPTLLFQRVALGAERRLSLNLRVKDGPSTL